MANSAHPSLAERLLAEPYAFDFFQAVRLLQRSAPSRAPVGLWGPPQLEAVRFRAQVSLSFPPSAISDLTTLDPGRVPTVLTQAFFGLTGPSGVLPRFYTELLLRFESSKEPEHSALRDWLDLFNHRLLSLFQRAWGKYRLPFAYEQSAAGWGELDAFGETLFSLIGFGSPSLRNRLVVSTGATTRDEPSQRKTLAQVDDLALVYYAGLLAHRPRNAIGLEALVADYFGVPARVTQHVGQWLVLESADMTRLGTEAAHNRLGAGAVLGERVWDVQGKIRIHLGPLHYSEFVEFLPDPEPVPVRKAQFLLAHLVRLYVGQELDFDVQLILRGDEAPDCILDESQEVGPRLGWNTWLKSEPVSHDCDALFEGREVFQLD